MRTRAILPSLIVATLIMAPAQARQPAPATGQDKLAAMKESLKASMAALRSYEWVETTVISVKGEEKSRQQNRCYYGAEGKVQKIPIENESADSGKKPRGLRGKIAENKKEEISDSVKEALEMVKQYAPPDPARIQAAKDAGRVAVHPPDAKGNMSVTISDYLKAGDSLSIVMNDAANRITSVNVSSWTVKDKDSVALKIGFDVFPDGTVYPAKVQLEVTAENLLVAMENTGYRKSR